jgi:hypothetical protein
MFIVLSNRHGGKDMPDIQTLETQVAPEDQTLLADHSHSSSDARRAAAVEAAYILEALRK